LTRLEKETDRQTPNLSRTVFRLLSCARDGLAEVELSGLLENVLRWIVQLRQLLLDSLTDQIRPDLP